MLYFIYNTTNLGGEAAREQSLLGNYESSLELRATLDVPEPKSGGLVKNVGPFSKRKNPLFVKPPFPAQRNGMLRAGRVLVETGTRFSKGPRKGLGRRNI